MQEGLQTNGQGSQQRLGLGECRRQQHLLRIHGPNTASGVHPYHNGLLLCTIVITEPIAIDGVAWRQQSIPSLPPLLSTGHSVDAG